MQNDSVQSILSENVITAKPDTSFTQLQSMMQEFLIRHIPVVDEENILCGLVSRNDLARIYIHYLKQPNVDPTIPPDTKACDIMTCDVMYLDADANIKKAAKMMSSGEFHSVPVVDEARKVIGMVTSTDLMDYLAQFFDNTLK